MYLLRRFRDEFGIPEEKLVYLDYGFHLDRMAGRERAPGEPFTFGYIGTHIPAKGVDHLIQAFGQLSGESRLRIWGRDRGVETEGLKTLARNLQGNAGDRIEWVGEYRNQDIVPDVFNRCDAIVVPSIWAENSPLVIHEAQQARVPVITANYGGMAEYVHHGVNGLLFAHRDPESLAPADAAAGRRPGTGDAAGQQGLHSIGGRQRPGHQGPCPGSRGNLREPDPARGKAMTANIERTAVPAPESAGKPGPWAHHIRHQPRRLQPALHHVRGPLAVQHDATPPAQRGTA